MVRRVLLIFRAFMRSFPLVMPRFASFCAFVFLGLAQLPAQAAELELRNLTLTPAADGSEMLEIELSQPAKSSAFLLPNPPRLAIDLPIFRWMADRDALRQYKGRLVQQLRYARNSESKSRIVMELTTETKIERLSPVTDAHLRLRLRATGPSPAPLAANAAPTEARPPAVLRERGARTRMEAALKNPEAPVRSIIAPPPEPRATVAPTNKLDTKPGRTAPVISEPKAGASSATPRPMIVIDAGHGGQDPGASGTSGLQEKNLTLAYARELKRQLEATDRYRVTMTRNDDFFIPLRGRVDIARKAHGNLFVSIHADSAPGAEARGLSMYTLSTTASDAMSAKLAARENKADIINGVDLSGASKDVTDILIELAQRNSMARSATFAQNLIGGMRANDVNMLDHPHRTAGFAVLKAPDMPSALVEIGFLSQAQEEAALQTGAMRERIAGAIVKGIDSYFARTTTAGNP